MPTATAGLPAVSGDPSVVAAGTDEGGFIAAGEAPGADRGFDVETLPHDGSALGTRYSDPTRGQ